MKINYKRIFSLALLIAAVVGICSSCASKNVSGVSQHHSSAPALPVVTQTPDPEPTGPVTLSLGQTAEIGDNMGNPEGTVKIGVIQVTTKPADLAYGEHPANGYYVIVHVKAKADPSYTDGFNVNMFDFYALSDGTRQFQADDGNAFYAMSDSQNGSDITATLGAGQTSQGWVAFDVSSRHGTIAYAPNYDGQPIAEWSY